jgi:DNA-binding ferritin-like protein
MIFEDSSAESRYGTIWSSSLTSVKRGPVEDQALLRLLVERLEGVGARARARLDRLGSLDLVSQDVAIEVVRTLEEQLWMSRAQLPSATNSNGAS